MKIGTVIVFATIFAAVVGGVIYQIRKPLTPESPVTPVAGHGTEDPAPPVSPTAPFPKAVVDQPVFLFQPMQANTKASHSFTIRNEGQAPLLLARGRSSCTCTMSSLAQKEIPPGGSAEVTLEWQPKSETEDFRQTAKVKTNDPEHLLIDLSVSGAVQTPLRITPASPWNLGELPDSQSKPFEGFITSSTLESFKILSLECTNPDVKVEAVPITDAEKENLKALALPKSGYSIRGEIPASTPVGSVFYQVNIKTDVEDTRLEKDDPHRFFTFQITVTGRRTGPMTLWGAQWIEDKSMVEAGRVDPALGKKISLSLYVREEPEDGLKVLNVEAPEFFKVQLTPDPKFKGKKKRYVLDLEFLPTKLSTEQQVWFQENAVRIKTNHPSAPEFEFRVVFTVN